MMLACILIWNGMMYSYQYMLPGFFNEHLQVVIRIRTTMIRGGGSRKGDLVQVAHCTFLTALHSAFSLLLLVPSGIISSDGTCNFGPCGYEPFIMRP